MIAGDLAKQYLRKFPSAPTNQIAKMLIRDHPLIFEDKEAARGLVRYYRGAHGARDKDKLQDTDMIRSIEEGIELRYNPYGFPDAVDDAWTPMPLPIRRGRGVILADLHLPYHEVRALTMAFGWATKELYTDFVVYNGDFFDFHGFSKFERDPEARKFSDDIKVANALLDATEKAFPSAQIILKLGNHDNRLRRYLRTKAPELFDLQDFLIEEQLQIRKRGAILVPHDVPLTVGRLNILHGHEIRSFSAVNPARGMFLKSLECTISAHLHKTSQHTSVTMMGRNITCWSLGCLCNLHPEYARINDWNWGCAGITVDGTDFEIDNRRIFEDMVR